MRWKNVILSTAYVLILLDYDYPDVEVMSQLNMLPSVVEVNKVEGPYDIVVKLSDDNMSVLKESIGKYMIRIRGIQSTLTLMEEWLFRLVSFFYQLTGKDIGQEQPRFSKLQPQTITISHWTRLWHNNFSAFDNYAWKVVL